MRATAILVRHQNGYRWVQVADPDLRIEIPQGHSGDTTEVIAKATAELATYGEGQTEITVGIDPPAGDPVWGEDIDVGDEVFVDGAWREVVAYTEKIEDGTGRKTIVPQFGSVLDAADARIHQAFKAAGAGVNGGTSHLARPSASIPPPNIRP